MSSDRTSKHVLSVYYGTRLVGELEDHGGGDVRAFHLTESGRVAIGTFPDRRLAMRALPPIGKSQKAVSCERAGREGGCMTASPRKFKKRKG
jgi:hypothetical protein